MENFVRAADKVIFLLWQILILVLCFSIAAAIAAYLGVPPVAGAVLVGALVFWMRRPVRRS
jgi:branched-subunit amino acid transport protein AzlD